MTMYYNTLSPGFVLNGNHYNYKIEKVLGQGTFGITYLAKVSLQGQLGQLDSNVHVTIKEFFMKEINGREGTSVTASSTGKGGLFYDYKQKFAREAKNLSKLKHPNIVNVMDYFEANNTCYYVMEYLSGGDLDTLIEKRGGLSEEETIRFTRQIGAALSFMHQNKMLHLDLKPKNVMLNATGDAILIDFGLSKQYDSSGEPESSTTVGRGTPGYAPLEQANYQDGHGFPVTMDVYALGATMYKMLTGERAPEASVILNEGFDALSDKMRNVSSPVANIVRKSMSPTTKQRFQNVREMLSAISNVRKHAGDSGDGSSRTFEPEMTIVDTGSGSHSNSAASVKELRSVIEGLQQQGLLKEAYNQCIENIRNNVDVEFSKEKSQELVELLKEQTKKGNVKTIILFIVILIVSLIILYYC